MDNNNNIYIIYYQYNIYNLISTIYTIQYKTIILQQ